MFAKYSRLKTHFLLASLLVLANFGNCFAEENDVPDNPLPNRLMVVNSIGQYQVFNLDHLSDIRFVNVPDHAECSLEMVECSYDRVAFNVALSDETTSFLIGVAPAETEADYENDLEAIDWLVRNNAPEYAAFQENLEVAGEGELIPETGYIVLAAAKDRFGVFDKVSRVSFTASEPEIIGSPAVMAELSYPDSRTVDVVLTPNQDVSRYYMTFDTEGRYDNYYRDYMTLHGYKSFEAMIVEQGNEFKATSHHSFGPLANSQNYELIVVTLDQRGTPMPAERYRIQASASGHKSRGN